MTLDLDALRREAEEGLAIAEKATPWSIEDLEGFVLNRVVGREMVGGMLAAVEECVSFDASTVGFIADARTRAPKAYAAVIELCGALTQSEDLLRAREASHDAAMSALLDEGKELALEILRLRKEASLLRAESNHAHTTLDGLGYAPIDAESTLRGKLDALIASWRRRREIVGLLKRDD